MRLNKWELGVIVLILLAFFGIAWAIDEQITVSSTPIGLTAAKYGQLRNALITVETNDIRFTLDGVTVPTSGGAGIKLFVGQSLTLGYQNDLSKFSAVRDSGTNAKLSVTYY
jgi:hypothetical protein